MTDGSQMAPSNYGIRNVSSLVMLISGIAALLVGVVGVVEPDVVLALLGFEIVEDSQRASHDYTLIFILASSVVSMNVGVYYTLAALSNLKEFYSWAVAFRCVTFVLLTVGVLSGYAPASLLIVAFWEFAGAVATGIALGYERRYEGV
jgi:uncharacterized membrane protein YuzA (DUF378 family)